MPNADAGGIDLDANAQLCYDVTSNDLVLFIYCRSNGNELLLHFV
jgi:hypothetical protein